MGQVLREHVLDEHEAAGEAQAQQEEPDADEPEQPALLGVERSQGAQRAARPPGVEAMFLPREDERLQRGEAQHRPGQDRDCSMDVGGGRTGGNRLSRPYHRDERSNRRQREHERAHDVIDAPDERDSEHRGRGEARERDRRRQIGVRPAPQREHGPDRRSVQDDPATDGDAGERVACRPFGRRVGQVTGDPQPRREIGHGRERGEHRWHGRSGPDSVRTGAHGANIVQERTGPGAGDFVSWRRREPE